jgi:hypothetical protein
MFTGPYLLFVFVIMFFNAVRRTFTRKVAHKYAVAGVKCPCQNPQSQSRPT